MPNSEIETLAEQLAMLAIKFACPPSVPQHIIESHRNAPWLTLSLATLYLSFAKHWLAFLPVPEVAKAVGKRMDDEFFDYVTYTRFDVNISEVIVQPSERVAVCQHWQMSPEEFFKATSDSDSVLGVVFADRSNQYTKDLRRGIVQQLEGRINVLGPIVFVYKRFNQHMYGVECDPENIDLDEALQFLFDFDIMFMNALESLTVAVTKGGTTLPFSV